MGEARMCYEPSLGQKIVTCDTCKVCPKRLEVNQVARQQALEVSREAFTRLRESKTTSSRRRGECIHLGKVLDRVACNCPMKFVRACEVHDKCTLGPNDRKIQSCESCPDFEADRLEAEEGIGAVRNLLYYIYPLSGNNIWKWNIEQLRRRLGLFNGSIKVAIAVDPRTVSGEEVIRSFGSDAGKVEFRALENDPSLREVAAHELLFSSVETDDPDHVTLFAHAKGVSRPGQEFARIWTTLLYETLMDYWPVVRDILRDHPLAGSFKKLGHGWSLKDSSSTWHYSGSWFWFRNRDLFSRDWRRIDRFWSGIEPYPSLHFSRDEAGSVFHDGHVPTLNLYSLDYIKKVVLPAYTAWKSEHAHQQLNF